MKKLSFTKMAGAGNDFVMLEAKTGMNYRSLATKACDRTNGIGADGLIILGKSKKSDYGMRIINADGSEAEMCGNGVRCLAAYIVRHHKPKKRTFSIETLAGEILAEAEEETAHVRLSPPKDYKADLQIEVEGKSLHLSYIDTGVPHAVIFVDGLKDIHVKTIGEKIRYHKAFQPRGTNVNFVEQVKTGLVHARTYERGVEDETKACGTGSVAAAIVAYLQAHPGVLNKKAAKMKVRTSGNEILAVTFDIDNASVSNVWLKGSARFIMKGEYYV